MGLDIAETTIKQLGGYNRLRVMISADMFIYDREGTLQFKFKGSRRVNTVEIKLQPNDTYTMTFYKVTNHGLNMREVKRFDDVYCEQLREIFEHETGLYLSLQ